MDFPSANEDHKRYAMITRHGGETCKDPELDDALQNTIKIQHQVKFFD